MVTIERAFKSILYTTVAPMELSPLERLPDELIAHILTCESSVESQPLPAILNTNILG